MPTATFFDLGASPAESLVLEEMVDSGSVVSIIISSSSSWWTASSWGRVHEGVVTAGSQFVTPSASRSLGRVKNSARYFL